MDLFIVQDDQQEDKNLYAQLKKDLDSILLKAWNGESKLSDTDITSFKKIIRYKDGQQLFIVLLNQFRTKRNFTIRNKLAFEELGRLLQILLQKCDRDDTSIPINCQVLASAYYLTDHKNSKKFLYEMIMGAQIWKDMKFWERALTQYLQFDIIQQIDETYGEESVTRDSYNVQ